MARKGAAPRTAGTPRALPPWVGFLVLALLALWGGRELTRHATASGVGIVDSSRFTLHEGAVYTHPAWHDRVARVLRRTNGSVPADDPAAIEALRAELASLSFVAEAGTPEVIWPDGLSVPLRYRAPVGCLRVGDFFLPVDAEGALLLGKSVTPHEAYGAWLPVLGRPEVGLELARAGDRLVEPRHLEAVAVATSMWNHLAPDDIAVLGRIVIDATSPFAPDGLPGGVVIDLEERRRILFGRPPVHPALADEARRENRGGELPLQDKWANVAAAARALAQGEDWVLFDARWDVPEVILRGSEYDLTVASRAPRDSRASRADG